MDLMQRCMFLAPLSNFQQSLKTDESSSIPVKQVYTCTWVFFPSTRWTNLISSITTTTLCSGAIGCFSFWHYMIRSVMNFVLSMIYVRGMYTYVRVYIYLDKQDSLFCLHTNESFFFTPRVVRIRKVPLCISLVSMDQYNYVTVQA